MRRVTYLRISSMMTMGKEMRRINFHCGRGRGGVRGKFREKLTGNVSGNV